MNIPKPCKDCENLKFKARKWAYDYVKKYPDAKISEFRKLWIMLK